MKAKTLIEELTQLPPGSEVHILIADYAPKAWRKIVSVVEEKDPEGHSHAVLCAFAGKDGFAFYDPSGGLGPISDDPPQTS